MIEVFKTNVEEVTHARKLIGLLLQHFPDSKINFDLSDCDRILRVEGTDFRPEKVLVLVEEAGYYCRPLD